MHSALRLFICCLSLIGFSGKLNAEEPPKRVVSLNVCTDQLAMRLALPNQLVSISFLARDPKSSLLHEEALAYPTNNGSAEEAFHLNPDLVLAGSYTTKSTVEMLRRLGFRVEVFAPENSIEEIKLNIIRIGDLLGNQTEANVIVSEINKRLLSVQQGPMPKNVTAAFYYSNSYTAGKGSLMSDIAQLAGVSNIADSIGIIGLSPISLEQLIRSNPNMIVENEIRETSPAMAQQNFMHPAFGKLTDAAKRVTIDGRVTACGGPETVTAIEQLHTAALNLDDTQ